MRDTDLAPASNVPDTLVEDHPTPESRQNPQPSSIRRFLDMREIIAFFRDLVVILAAILLIRTFIAAPFQINGSSMETNFHDKEFIIVDKLSYLHVPHIGEIGDPERGDVVVLHPHEGDEKFYIKRIIGMPGDTVRFDEGEVYITPAGTDTQIQLEEPYLSAINQGKTFLPLGMDNDVFIVPDGAYFVMGDNRNNSSDSRTCFRSCSIGGSSHYVPRENIVGKAFFHLGYFELFDTQGGLGSMQWISEPRFFSTVKSWEYPEIETIV